MWHGIIANGLVYMMALAASDAAWWDPAWAWRQRVSLNASEIAENLIDFPLGLHFTDAEFARTRAASDGRDLRAVDAQGRVLEIEIVRWDAEGVEFYVKVPEIVAGRAGQYVNLYYGNPRAEMPPKGSLWDAHYRAVLHLAGNLEDARGGAAASVQGGVRVKDMAIFDGDPAFLEMDPKRLEGLGEQISIAVRFRYSGGPALQNLASGRRTDRNEWFNFGIKLPDTVHTNAVSANRQAPELNPKGISPDQWHSAVVVYDAPHQTRTIAIDGCVLERDQALPGPLEVTAMRVGRGLLHFDPWQFHGAMDEVRLSDVARSDSWIRAESACLGDRNTFAALGPPQQYGKPAPPPAPFDLIAPADGAVSRSRAGLTLEWRPSAGAASYTVLLYDEPGAVTPSATFDTGGATRFTLSSSATPRPTARRRLPAVQPPTWWTVRAVSGAGETPAAEKRKLSFYDWSKTMTTSPQEKITPVLNPARDAAFAIGGYLRKRVDKSIQRYFLETPESSPAILQVLRDRDKTPVRDPLVPWAGEFAGKYLTGAELVWRLTRDTALKAAIDAFVKDLIACQAPNGYLGPFPESSRLTGGNWDVWGHYHCMLGLLLYYEDTQFEPALDACRKMGDLLFETFGPGGPTLTCDGAGGQMNMAVCHSLVLLYKKTGVERYLELANYIVHDAWNEENAGKYLESALAGKKVHEFPQHRWEALHDYQALPEMYWLTGDDRYRRAFEQIWWTGLEGDRHNTGGVTSGEGFCGSPYNPGAIETCCTVAWIAMSVDMLRLTGDSRVADEIEWSTLNSALGAIPYSGRVCAYNVPMDGTRTFGVELPWQSPKAGPDLNCCAVNAYRPLGMAAQWALMQNAAGLALNFYGPGSLSAALPSGNRVTLTEETEYPIQGRVKIGVACAKPESFALSLRIPSWSKQIELRVNGEPLEESPIPGTYCAVNRTWQTGDAIEIGFDFSLRFWAGENECAGKLSVYRGPLLYAYDARYNEIDPDRIPKLDWASAVLENARWEGPLEPWCLATLRDKNGLSLQVCDFSSAGQTGNHYRSWFAADNLPPAPFYLSAPELKDGQAVFEWPSSAGAERWTLRVLPVRNTMNPIELKVQDAPRAAISLKPGTYCWTVTAENSFGSTSATNGPWPFVMR